MRVLTDYGSVGFFTLNISFLKRYLKLRYINKIAIINTVIAKVNAVVPPTKSMNRKNSTSTKNPKIPETLVFSGLRFFCISFIYSL